MKQKKKTPKKIEKESKAKPINSAKFAKTKKDVKPSVSPNLKKPHIR